MDTTEPPDGYLTPEDIAGILERVNVALRWTSPRQASYLMLLECRVALVNLSQQLHELHTAKKEAESPLILQ